MKKSFSKILSAVLVLILIASLCGCTQPVEEEPNNPNIPDDPTPGIVTRYDTLEEYLAQTIEDEVWVEASWNYEDGVILSDNPKAEEFVLRWEKESVQKDTMYEATLDDGSTAMFLLTSRTFAVYGDYLYTCGYSQQCRPVENGVRIGDSHEFYFLYEININTGEQKVLEETFFLQSEILTPNNHLGGVIDNLWVSSNALLYQEDGALILRSRSTGQKIEIWPKREYCFVMLTRPLSSNEFLFAVESAEFKQYLIDNHVHTMTPKYALDYPKGRYPASLDYYIYNGQLGKIYFLGQSSLIDGRDLRDFGDPIIPELLEEYYVNRDKDIAAIE